MSKNENPKFEMPDDPIGRCGYFWFSLPLCHPFTPCCIKHDDGYGDPVKTVQGAIRRIFLGSTHEGHTAKTYDFTGPHGIELDTTKTRKQVDKEFLNCMNRRIKELDLGVGYQRQAKLMYFIVRAVGWAFWPKPPKD